MDTVIRNVNEIEAGDRPALEHVLGRPLRENQQLVIRIVDREVSPPQSGTPPPPNGTPVLPEWCNVYEGLSDEQIAEIEKLVLQRADLSRPSD